LAVVTRLEGAVGGVPGGGRKPAAMIVFDHGAVAATPARFDDGSGGRCVHRIPAVAAKIDAGMHRWPAEERVGTHAKARRLVELTFDGLAHRHGSQRAGEAFDV